MAPAPGRVSSELLMLVSLIQRLLITWISQITSDKARSVLVLDREPAALAIHVAV